MNKAIILIAALILSLALTSGLLFSFSIAVSPGLKTLSDIEYIKTMKSINRKIQNYMFFICFFSPLALFPVIAYQQFNSFRDMPFLLTMGGMFYFVGVFGITALVNVPLNNQLENFDLLAASSKRINTVRNVFESRWNFWHNIRTVSSIASLLMVLLALIEYRQN